MMTKRSEQHTTFADRVMRIVWRRPAQDAGERARRRVTLYLIPYLFFCTFWPFWIA